jgi:hypothetical protein
MLNNLKILIKEKQDTIPQTTSIPIATIYTNEVKTAVFRFLIKSIMGKMMDNITIKTSTDQKTATPNFEIVSS